MKLWRRKIVEEMPYVGPRFGHVELDGRKIYLCGFLHGHGLVGPGKIPREATRHLLATEQPYVMVEGLYGKRVARALKHRKVLQGEFIEKELASHLRNPDVGVSIKKLFGFNPHKQLRGVIFKERLLSPIDLIRFRQELKKYRDEIFEGVLYDDLRYFSQQAAIALGKFNSSSSNFKEKLDFFAGHFRSFLMADAILHRHATLSSRASIALFCGIEHAGQVAAFLQDRHLFNAYAEWLPAPLTEIHRRVSEARMRRQK